MNDGDFTIKTATETNLRAAFKLMSELGYIDLDFDAFTEVYIALLKDPATTLLVAEATEGPLIALASISRRPQLRLGGDLVTIDELVVSSAARGRGVGRAILDRAKEIALNARRLELQTNRGRESYQRGFYLKNGFSEADSAVMRIDFGAFKPRM